MLENSDKFLNWLKEGNFDYAYSKETIYMYYRIVVAFNKFISKTQVLSLNEVNVAILRNFIKINQNGSKSSKSSITVKLSALHLFFYWANQNKLCHHDPVSDYKESEQETRKLGGRGGNKPLRLKSTLWLHEIDNVLDVTGSRVGFNPVRDLFYMGLILTTGIRADESTQILLPTFNFEQGKFKLVGKGNKERIVEIIDKEWIRTAYQAYLIKREEKLKKLGIASDLLFITNRGTSMFRRLIYQQVAHYMQLANVQTERIGPHTLRHTAASLMYHHKNIALTVIQRNFGHSKPETTLRYLHLIPKV